MLTFTVSELAERVGARVEGDPSRRVTGVAPLATAGPEDLAFFVRRAHRARLAETKAGALLASETLEVELAGTTLLRVEDPELAFAQLLPVFFPEPASVPGVHPTAVLGRGVRLGADVSIGAHSVVEPDARIGARTVLGASSLIGRGALIGEDCRLGHGTSILRDVELGDRVIVHVGSRIGTDGFGYAAGPEGARKIPQVGGCSIGDDVEIGANCTVDRGALGDTTIGPRTKLDNLVHIGHNVEIGPDCMIVAQVGVAGSVTIEQGAALAGQAGIAGHLTIGAGAQIAAQSGVIGDVPAGATFGGYPARSHRLWMRASATMLKLPALVRRLSDVERRLEERDGPG